jgi:hypothetical protein
MARTPRIEGSNTTLKFAVECIDRGAFVSSPIGDCPYDLIVHTDRLRKVEVKTAWLIDPDRGLYAFNGTRKVPAGARSRGGGPSSVSVPYRAGDIDCLVAKAGDSWFFFEDPSKLTGKVEVRTSADRDNFKWNFGKNKWEILGLPADRVRPR